MKGSREKYDQAVAWRRCTGYDWKPQNTAGQFE